MYNPVIGEFARSASFYHTAAAQNEGGFLGSLGGLLGRATPIVPVAFGGGGMTPNRHMFFATDADSAREFRRGEKEDKADDRAEKAAWIGGIVTLVFAGLSACTLQEYYKDLEELKKAQEFKTTELPRLDAHIRNPITVVVNKHIEVLEARSIRSRNVAVITGLVLACGVATFIGGMFALAWLVTTAIVIGVISAALGIFLTAWHWNDQITLPENMQNQLRQLERDHQPGEPGN